MRTAKVPARRSVARAPAYLSLVALLLLAACSSTANVPPRPHPTATPSPMATATSTPAPGPTPVSGLLDEPPSQCPAAPAPQTMSFPQGFGKYPDGVKFFGADIVWIPAPSFPTVAHLEPHGAVEWPTLKITWEVGPDATDAVSVRVTNAQTGVVLWWIHATPPTLASQTLVLDPDVPGPAMYLGAPEKNWKAFDSILLISEAGCYALDATWAGGSWHTVFAAGR
ncbi:MAG: hypothetical protein ACHQ4H_14460 [Ktedonobacterales bacterium]